MRTIDDYIGILAVTAVACLAINYFDSSEAGDGAYILAAVIAVYLLILFSVRRLRSRHERDEEPSQA